MKGADVVDRGLWHDGIAGSYGKATFPPQETSEAFTARSRNLLRRGLNYQVLHIHTEVEADRSGKVGNDPALIEATDLYGVQHIDAGLS